MKHNAFKLKLKPGCADEYKRRHGEVWPELVKAHSDAGILYYSIYFDEETLTLFAIQILSDNNTVDDLKNLEIVQKWWDHMADLMETYPSNMPIFQPLSEVFHMA
ncbi:L-rhamnose mutarotase [Tichowtungia aerotolerans]|uniref:L-rhamnose mutarotase n=1 Tax=Tichowtungia aerotolerans TaxID=2697043 RepID=A0A6P1M3S0_9BACT|nr:L-rhamnose mutarotase [Tichowtungia aerotolerans]QHI68481.1 L-rhamnose mutarotase [Tichowtungia aerotolerans]